MSYGDKKNASDNVNKMWKEVGSYTQTMNKTFDLMNEGGIDVNLFEVSEGEEYLNKITKSLNLDAVNSYELSFDMQGGEQDVDDPSIYEAYGLDSIEGLDFSPESVSKGYYDKVVKYIEGDGKASVIRKFMKSNEFNNLSDENKEKYYNFADAIEVSTSIATITNSMESEVFEGDAYQNFRRKDGTIGTATGDNFFSYIDNVMHKNSSTGQSFNILKEEFSSRNQPKNLGTIVGKLSPEESKFLQSFRESIEK